MTNINQIPILSYLSNVVEGYLFCDLKNMSTIKPEDGEVYGGVGYPMIMTVCAGIELLGGLLTKKNFNKYDGDEYFINYWNSYLTETDPCYFGYAKDIYELARHGIAHAFITKPGILITKQYSPLAKVGLNKHYNQVDIDCIKFYKDFEKSYIQLLKPKLESLQQVMQKNLDKMLTDYSKQSTLASFGYKEEDLTSIFSTLFPNNPASAGASGVAHTMLNVPTIRLKEKL